MTVTAVMSPVGLHPVLPSIAWTATRNVRFIKSIWRKTRYEATVSKKGNICEYKPENGRRCTAKNDM
jgi:hypothetical protein